MKIRLLSVGRPKDREAGALHDRYAERIVRLGVPYGSESCPETRSGGRYSDAHVLEREGRELLARTTGGGFVVALDRSGRALSSPELAERLERWATPHATLIVGGPLGLDRSVLARADFVWSLSELTLPHELARLVVAEQLYRALSILRGFPYHK